MTASVDTDRRPGWLITAVVCCYVVAAIEVFAAYATWLDIKDLTDHGQADLVSPAAWPVLCVNLLAAVVYAVLGVFLFRGSRRARAIGRGVTLAIVGLALIGMIATGRFVGIGLAPALILIGLSRPTVESYCQH